MPPETLPGLLQRAAALSSGGAADAGLRFVDRREAACWVPWAEIHTAATHLAGGLLAAGVEPRDRVALVFPTGVGFFRAFFAILWAGAVPVPLYPPPRLGRLDAYRQRTAAMLKAAGARLVLADRRGLTIAACVAEEAGTELGARPLDDLAASSAEAVSPYPPTLADDLGLIQFSSGTTIAPKPVALSQRALIAQARLLNARWPDAAGERHAGVSWLPLYHDMGLIGGVLPALERPGELTLIAPEVFAARPAVWLRTISRFRATISPAPNFAYALATEKVSDGELEDVDLSSWRVALNGSEAVAPEVLRRFARRFAAWGLRAAALTPVYGLAEAALAVTFADIERPFASRRFDRRALAEGYARESTDGIELASLGGPLPGFDLRFLNGAGEVLPEGRVGKLLIAGPSLMEGYLGRPAETARVLRDGWLDTGDLGFLFRDELYLTGRAKDVIVLRGRNYSPVDIEQTLEQVAGVRPGAAVAVGCRGAASEHLLAFIEPRRGLGDKALAALSEVCQEMVLGRTGLLCDEVIVAARGSLPRTSSGKLRRRETLRAYRAGELALARRPARVGGVDGG